MKVVIRFTVSCVIYSVLAFFSSFLWSEFITSIGIQHAMLAAMGVEEASTREAILFFLAWMGSIALALLFINRIHEKFGLNKYDDYYNDSDF